MWFSRKHGTFIKKDNKLDHKTSLNEFRMNKIRLTTISKYLETITNVLKQKSHKK